MRVPLAPLVVIPATLAACDALVRMVLWAMARSGAPASSRPLRRLPGGTVPRESRPAGCRRSGRPEAGAPLHARRLLVVVPARAEGERLQQTLASCKGADVLLLLDGDDPNVDAHGARVVVKTPAGPSKAAALAWLAREHRALLETYDIILVLDAGSRLGPDFFEHFAWPEDATAVQTFLRGSSEGVGAAVAEAERVAQNSEDRGREALGWNVRLRGTGSAFTSKAFVELMPRLDTRIEDLEATLLLTADGATIRMTEAVVLDEKPEAMTAAASQRARWFLGRYELLVRCAPAFARVIARRPLEGTAFFVEIFGRPLSLMAPLRVAAGILMWRRGHAIFGGLLALSAAADVAMHTKARPSAVLRLGGSWLMALLLAPRALVRWMRA